jgi:ABC-type polysaccharide/polyol phosphate transport system, ATPase component
MSADAAIEVKGLGKRFDIGTESGQYMLLTEQITERLRTLGRRAKTQEFWALQDVDFEVKQGETFGVIGHNGAGKSTLLKILSRITPPTTGEARLRGRVGALLEVGTGFHPELTGRENVFLNGAILNMGRTEIQQRFDEIVEFADIGPFIDTPVKRYSSGMQLRLAFSVAAHLEPEILIVDEVLSVGDVGFQQKCLDRMQGASREGRTTVFISHNLSSVRNLCDRALLLSEGKVSAMGNVSEVIDGYIGEVERDLPRSLRERENRDGTGELRFVDVRLERDGHVIDSPTTGEDCDIVLSYEADREKPFQRVNFGITIFALVEESTPLLNLSSETAGAVFRDIPPHGEARCRLHNCPLPAGQYFISIWAELAGVMLDGVHRAFEMTVSGGDFYGSGRQPHPDHRTVLVPHEWSVTEASRPDLDGAPADAAYRAKTSA